MRCHSENILWTCSVLRVMQCSDELFIKNIWEEALKIKGNTELSAETQHITPPSCLTTPPKPLKQLYWHITKPSATFIYPVQSRLVTSHITMECGWWWQCFSFFIVMAEILYLCACWSICLVRFRIVVFANRNKSKFLLFQLMHTITKS